MRLAARCMATLAIAFAIIPALLADDTTKPKPSVTTVESPASVAATAADSSQPSTNATASAPYSSGLRLVSGNAQSSGAMHSWDEGEHYTPRVEWFLGYSFWRAMPTSSSNRMAYLHGGSTSIAYNFNNYLGLVADFGGYDNSKLTLIGPTGSQTFDSNGSAYSFAFGPRISYRRYERFTPFIQALFGGAHASSVKISGCTGNPTCTFLSSDTAFATFLGTGFDIKISRHIALRLLEADFLLTHFKDPFSSNGQGRGWQDNVRLSTGIVFRFGGSPPAPPPAALMASCSADKSMVYAESREIVTVRADVSNAGNSSLTYSWNASDGAVDGIGPIVRWNSSHAVPGVYTVKVRADNGRGGTAACSVDIRVEARPVRPPTLSCSADRSPIVQGESTGITADANDPENRQLTYSYSTSGGRILGNGPKVRFDSNGAAPGNYTVKCSVANDRGGTADASTKVEVQAPPPPPEVAELEARLSLHSIYFQTARPTEKNPGGGLVESQQEVLAALATDFNRYLTFKPDAHLTLGGHADVRGSEEYNKRLTERRVERAKSFLVEHGVPAGSIDVQSFGKDDNLTADQVKQQMQDDPDLTPEEHQRALANLQIIVLANNRRVDVSLSTTGQQSVRRYPFNAKDAMALISPSVHGKPPATTRTPKKP
jgi:outer membrane protein OmpA-like peptidoglycan-associated protein/opacity protein-like surface antigen